ncbi:sterol esterase [Pseudovirgaria hyperparasitica]|uniref:Carboxylic ester hydrolase n=1 Tax=Pseudovirgaria hyperparasitica TaxID=470096 RepID=A0A6A6W5Z7_9PEZI|nr:sterol esterase [Pseudovirgaria hyperparasitica]KAF2756481.1 sterol esterase [Pseudovirgaria hyperparasitica]
MLISTKAFVSLLLLAGAANSAIISAAKLFIGGPADAVNLDYASFRGAKDLRTGTKNYLGMPYARPERFRRSKLLTTKLEGVQDASDYGPACIQQSVLSILSPSPIGDLLGGLATLLEGPLLRPVLGTAEDCLSINVQAPLNATKDSKLPVVLWIHGGGFAVGSSAALGFTETEAIQGVIYQGANIVQHSINMNQPVVFASINYRLNAFGFSQSKELADQDALSLGFGDQRVAMHWVKKYISQFGGDPNRVTLFGESAGSMSIAGHLTANGGDTEGLYRGVIMASGAGLKVDDYTRQQGTFNYMLESVGCRDATDKLACLRSKPTESFFEYINQSPQFLGYHSTNVAWNLRADNHYLSDSPDRLIAKGQVADVPILIGDMKDEGTLFSLVNNLNITTTDDLIDYLQTIFFPNAPVEKIEQLVAQYPNDPSAGSPFDTGPLNAISPQYKRIAALIGDYTFQSERRQLLPHAKNKVYNYLLETVVPSAGLDGLPIVGTLLNTLKLANIPVLGSFHVSDVVLYWFGLLPPTVSRNSLHLMSVLVSFVNHLDPNQHGLSDLPKWPLFDESGRKTMHLRESQTDIITDDYRANAIKFINDNGDVFRT